MVCRCHYNLKLDDLFLNVKRPESEVYADGTDVVRAEVVLSESKKEG